jgi:type II secretory pathway pseudopilin PulG
MMMNTEKTTPSRPIRALGRGRGLVWAAVGFSLIEVLISIFVLALGLLGIAAVFPAVVRQQRQATDTVQGISIQRSVEQFLVSHEKLRERNVSNAGGFISQENSATPLGLRGWSVLSGDTTFSPTGEWTLANAVAGDFPVDSGVSLNPTTGAMFLGRTGTGQGVVEIPLSDRLVPRPYSTGVEPRFVWDFVARRVPSGQTPPSGNRNDPLLNDLRVRAFDDDAVQVAIFVRRIDTGLRLPRNRTLTEVLLGTQGMAQNDRRLPVTVDAAGLPTFDGRLQAGGGYSPIRQMRYTLVPNEAAQGRFRTDVIVASPTPVAMGQYFNQIGQRFVDDLGIVHEVVEIVRDLGANDQPALRIDPPLSPDLLSGRVVPIERLSMLYTPQIPASVSVTVVKR